MSATDVVEVERTLEEEIDGFWAEIVADDPCELLAPVMNGIFALELYRIIAPEEDSRKDFPPVDPV